LTQVAEEAHIPVGNPHQCEKCNQITSPIGVEQLELRDDKENGTDVMAKTIFASEEVEEFPFVKRLRTAANLLAVFSGFTENLFVRNGPSDAGNRNGDEEKVDNLGDKWHHNLEFINCR